MWEKYVCLHLLALVSNGLLFDQFNTTHCANGGMRYCNDFVCGGQCALDRVPATPNSNNIVKVILVIKNFLFEGYF
jgi:hypothetical protein